MFGRRQTGQGRPGGSVFAAPAVSMGQQCVSVHQDRTSLWQARSQTGSHGGRGHRHRQLPCLADLEEPGVVMIRLATNDILNEASPLPRVPGHRTSNSSGAALEGRDRSRPREPSSRRPGPVDLIDRWLLIACDRPIRLTRARCRVNLAQAMPHLVRFRLPWRRGTCRRPRRAVRERDDTRPLRSCSRPSHEG